MLCCESSAGRNHQLCRDMSLFLDCWRKQKYEGEKESAMDQDWTPVTLSKTNKQKVAGISNAAGLAAAKRDGLVATVSRTSLGGGSSVTGGSLRKLEESNDVFKHDTVNKELSKAITQARMVCILFSL